MAMEEHETYGYPAMKPQRITAICGYIIDTLRVQVLVVSLPGYRVEKHSPTKIFDNVPVIVHIEILANGKSNVKRFSSHTRVSYTNT